MSSKSLANIVRVAQRGNHAAFDLLVRRYAAPAIAYARVLLTGWSNSDVAEDVAQEAFVQAWRDLPQLREPEAFPAWLRRVVFKHCDRVRRATHCAGELPTTLATPRDTEPAQYVERNAENEVLHNALRRLPEAYRDVTLLYYFNDLDVATTGQTLGIPASTVKNRLFAARKRLRKELSTMNETSAVSNNSDTNKSTTAFAQSVLAKILGDYRAQNAADPLNANRTLLDTGVAELRRVLESGTTITDELCRDALTLLWQRWDFQTLAAFLSRYLVEPNLSASHRAWAYLHLANALALTGSAAGAVLAHEAWEREGSDGVCLLEWFPYYPAPQDTAEATYRGDEVALLFLSQSVEFAETYAAVWRE
ncbi:MAG: sigma-70 family RNA polymerase sigma factor, partial [Armatimonadetes bacterium]|nr:sigma-70 family RNA polymerase sigma factor [Armatimonadota bacterium]